MGHELKSLFQVDTRKLIWLIGITFAVIVTFQYLELPYGNVLSSLFPSGKISVEEQGSFLDISPSSAAPGSNFNGTIAANETAHDAEIFEGKDIDFDVDVISAADVGLNKSSAFDEGTEAPKESSTADLVELNNNTTVENGESSISEESDSPSSAESGSDLNGTIAANETAHDAEIFEGNDIDFDVDVISEADVGLNKSSAFDEGTEAPKVPSTAELVELNNNTTVDNGESSKSEETEKEGFASGEVRLNRSSILDNTSSRESSREESEDLNQISTVNFPESFNNSSTAENVGKTEVSFSSKNGTVDISTLSSDTGLGTTISTLEKDVETNVSTSIESSNSSITSVEQHAAPSLDKNEKSKSKEMQNNFAKPGDDSSPPKAPKKKKKPVMTPALTTIADMNNLFYQSRVSYEYKTPRWSSSADKVQLEARLQIENAPIIKNDPQLYAPLYRNVSMFKRSYELMKTQSKYMSTRKEKDPSYIRRFSRVFMPLKDGS